MSMNDNSMKYVKILQFIKNECEFVENNLSLQIDIFLDGVYYAALYNGIRDKFSESSLKDELIKKIQDELKKLEDKNKEMSDFVYELSIDYLDDDRKLVNEYICERLNELKEFIENNSIFDFYALRHRYSHSAFSSTRNINEIASSVLHVLLRKLDIRKNMIISNYVRNNCDKLNEEQLISCMLFEEGILDEKDIDKDILNIFSEYTIKNVSEEEVNLYFDLLLRVVNSFKYRKDIDNYFNNKKSRRDYENLKKELFNKINDSKESVDAYFDIARDYRDDFLMTKCDNKLRSFIRTKMLYFKYKDAISKIENINVDRDVIDLLIKYFGYTCTDKKIGRLSSGEKLFLDVAGDEDDVTLINYRTYNKIFSKVSSWVYENNKKDIEENFDKVVSDEGLKFIESDLLFAEFLFNLDMDKEFVQWGHLFMAINSLPFIKVEDYNNSDLGKISAQDIDNEYDKVIKKIEDYIKNLCSLKKPKDIDNLDYVISSNVKVRKQ